MSLISINSILDDGPCLGWREAPKSGWPPPGAGLTAEGRPPLPPYRWLTYSQVKDRAKAIGSGLIGRLGVKPGQNTFVGLFTQSGITVSLHNKFQSCSNLLNFFFF